MVSTRRVWLLVASLSLLIVGLAPAADSLNVRLVGWCSTGEAPVGVVGLGDYAYIAVDGESALRVISVADPAHPVEVGRCWTPDLAYDVAVVGDYAYLADNYEGLRIISVADPTRPAEVGYCDTPGQPHGVTVDWQRALAYVADAPGGLRVVSIADPTDPVEIGSCVTSGRAWSVALDGDHAYVAADDAGLRVISIADPAHPIEVGHCDTEGSALDVVVAGSCAFVADGLGGLRFVSVSDPAKPAEIGYYDTPGGACGVELDSSHEYAYVADYDSGLRVITTDFAHPTEVGYYLPAALNEAYDVAVLGVYACVAVGGVEPGLQILQFYGGGVEETPNPEVRATKCAPTLVRSVLFLAGSTNASSSPSWLLDAAGRKVLDIRPGANDVSKVAPGVYFVRQASSVMCGASSVTKVLIVR